MTISFCGLELAHPVVNGSGTFDALAARRVFGDALGAAFPFSAFVSKTITAAPRDGNPPPRLWETAAGMVNSIGLPNKGLDNYLAHDLPELARLPVPIITNVMGNTGEEVHDLVAAVSARDEVAAIELNVSCPNVKTGLDIGAVPEVLRAFMEQVRPATTKPLIVKLTPNTADVPACAAAAEDGGADAVSLINTLRAMPLAPRDGHVPLDAPPRPWLGGGTGGQSGPAVRTIALAQVGAVCARVAIPVIGMGGIQTAAHARQFLDAGATLVAVGTESFRDPAVGGRIAADLGWNPANSGNIPA